MKIKVQISILMLTVILACSKKNDVSPKDSMVNSITSTTWVTESVYNETDGDLTSQYANFSIVFRKTSSGDFAGEYYVANGSYAFASAYGKWNISDDLKTMQFDNGRSITMELNNNVLKLDFTVAAKGGRIDGLSGHFIFTLKPA